MFKLVLICLVAFGTASPAFAGERSVPPPGIKAVPLRAIPLPRPPALSLSAREVPIVETVAVPVRNNRASTFVLPTRTRAAAFDLGAPATTRQFVPSDAQPESIAASPFAFPEPRALPAWQLTAGSSEVTARSGGRYAVGETLADHRRVGPPRSALDAMLVFRIDGSNDSPPLSVGGGVAGAMWKAGLTR